jgi:hypothetical protein
MKSNVTSVWFEVGPETTPKGMKGPALTMRPSCPLYNEDDWLVTNKLAPAYGQPRMMTAYSGCGELLNLMQEETGLKIMEIDTHYVLQIHVAVPNPFMLREVRKKLEAFVNRHFEAYIPAK